MIHRYYLATSFFLLAVAALLSGQTSEPIHYNHPGLVVDLGVGLWAWPLPMDYDEDGDLDLIVACPDKPYNRIYFFENPGGKNEMPIFKPGKRLGPAARNLQISNYRGQPIVLGPGMAYPQFIRQGLSIKKEIPLSFDFKKHHERPRANQWKYVNYEGDGDHDLLIGIGDWTDYGWDNAFNDRGEWTRGPLHGYVYLARNGGTEDGRLYYLEHQK